VLARWCWLLCLPWFVDAAVASGASFEELSRLPDVRASWVASDGRTLATGAGRLVHWGAVGPPMQLTQSLTLDVEVVGGVIAGPRLIFTTTDRRLGLLQLDHPATSPHYFALDPAPHGAIRVAQESGHILLAEQGRGLRRFRIRLGAHAHHGGIPELIEELSPSSIPSDPLPPVNVATAGRWRLIASDEQGLSMVRSRGGAPQLFPVAVSNDFFSPQIIAVDVGDTVRWTNASGFHNVDSCDEGELGCEGEISAEIFRSGQPQDPLWIFSHEFTQAGLNRYVCESHAPFMWASVEVATPTPPSVPDGVSGPPLLVGKLDARGSQLQLDWDSGSCSGALDHQILYGNEGGFPAIPGGIYELSGASCAVGAASSVSWLTPPALDQPAQRLLWWLIVATDGQAREGGWGSDSSGLERRGAGPGGSSLFCGSSGKTLANRCGQ